MKDHLKKDKEKTWCGLVWYKTNKDYFPLNLARHYSLEWYDKPIDYHFLLSKFKCEKCGMNYMKNLEKKERKQRETKNNDN